MRTPGACCLVLLFVAGSAAGQCGQFYGTSGPGDPIPDPGVKTYPISCGSYGTVGTIRVDLRISHGRQGDLIVRLRHNATGRVATLLSRPGTEDGLSTEGYTAAHLGDPAGGGGAFVLMDGAPGPYAVPPVGVYPRPGVSSIVGTFRPTVDSFATFAGTTLLGNWTLEIEDAAAGVQGGVVSWVVSFTPAEPDLCYANCDHSATVPFLNVQDFACYLHQFAFGSTYANCDGSTTPPVLNVQDFACFLNAFSAGCSAP